jgi:hypothetical protein
MAKPIIVLFGGAESSFDHAKVDRTKLYGARKRVPLDASESPCVKASLTTDGLYLLQSGMTAQGYFDESGRWLQKADLVGLDDAGNTLELKPSTLGAAQTAQEVDAAEILRHTIDAVYALDPMQMDGALQAKLDGGAVFRFPFNYGADYHLETAFLVKNTDGCFCLIGVPFDAAWAEPGKVAAVEEAETVEDDLDFDMF